MSLGYFALFLFVVSNTQAHLFETLDHSVEGEVKIEGHTIVVENFSYNGTAPDAFFYVEHQEVDLWPWTVRFI